MPRGSKDIPVAYTLEEVAELLPTGVRLTPQRREVYEVVARSCDHPTAAEVFERASADMSTISLATVYNCLETLSACHAIRQVNLDRTSTRYCANKREHVHFHCESCGQVVDAPPKMEFDPTRLWKLPTGSSITTLDIAVRGTCPACSKTTSSKR